MPKISSFSLWILLGALVALIPIACSSSSSNNDGNVPVDTAQKPDSMTKG
jgi:hypothetical protein